MSVAEGLTVLHSAARLFMQEGADGGKKGALRPANGLMMVVGSEQPDGEGVRAGGDQRVG